jgi:hypothetical protein
MIPPQQEGDVSGPWQTLAEEKAWEMLVTSAERRLVQTGGDVDGAIDVMLGDDSAEMNTIKRDLWPATIRRAVSEAEERQAEQGGG